VQWGTSDARWCGEVAGCRLDCGWPTGGAGGAETWRKEPRSCGEEDDEKEEFAEREEEEATRGRERRDKSKKSHRCIA
jgi:hypothetical protein